MRMAVAAAAILVVAGIGGSYALMGGKAAPQKAPAVVKGPQIPKSETALPATLISAPKHDQTAKLAAVPIPPLDVPVKAKSKAKTKSITSAKKATSAKTKAKAKANAKAPRPPQPIKQTQLIGSSPR